MPRQYDVVIIGSGPAGYVSAIRLRQLNRSVCVIDLDETRFGGVCLNEGCIPLKSLIYSSRLFSDMKRAKDYGLEAEIKAPSMKKIIAFSQGAVSQLRSSLTGLFKKYNIEFVIGRARLISRNEVSIKSKDGKEEKIKANKIIVATGSRPNIPQNIKVDGEKILTSREMVKLIKIPKTLLIVGAGSVGVEFCSVFSSFGSKVTLVEMTPRILPFLDMEISNALTAIFKKKGIEILVNTKVKVLHRKADNVEAVLDEGDKERKIESECVLIAIGRKPNTQDLGLQDIGVKIKDGFIVTDERMCTNIENIYAAGDVLNTPMYAHVAYREALIAAEDIAGLDTEPIDYACVPTVVFSEPQTASVGLTESEAEELKGEIAISKYFFKANGLAVATRREDGFIKIIADKKTEAILGVHIIGGNATEILHEFVVAKSANLTVDDIAKAIHAHPTFSEIAVDAAKATFGKPIHG